MPRFSAQEQRQDEARRLQRLREVLGFSQRELALELRVAHGAIGLWEAGARTIPGPVLKLIELYEEELDMSQAGSKGHSLKALRMSWASRSLKLSRTTAGATARLFASALEGMLNEPGKRNSIRATAQVAVARQLVETLGEMKGLTMKVGQMVSYLDFAMPDAAREVLSTLQSSSPPMAPAVVADVFLEEFGKSPRELFADWSPEPFAAASIGQVHHARLRSGEAVVVKVQYPGIAKTFDADLRNVALLDQIGSLLFRGQERGAFLAELRERFLEECDYRLEAEHQEKFRGLFSGRPGIVVPKAFKELSSRRVLVSERMEGRSFKEFCATATPAERNRAGETLWSFAFESIFRHGIFNGDPHPGNYLFQDWKVVFLDFGCVKRFEPEFIARWKRFIRAVLERDSGAADRLAVEMGLVPDPRHYDFEAHHRMIRALYEPWLLDQEFEFDPAYVARTWKLMAVENPNKFRMNLPKDWVFTNRLQWGLYSILAALRAKANWREKILAQVYEPADPRPRPFDPQELSWREA